MNRYSLRASKADHAYACPASLDRAWPEEPSGVPARIGSAVHEAMDWYLSSDGLDDDRLAMIEAKYNVDSSEFRPAFWQTRYAFEQIREDLPMSTDMETERYFEKTFELPTGEEMTLTGHVDLFDLNGSTAIIVDYKTGWVDRPCEIQMRVYAALAFLADDYLLMARVYVLRPRLGSMDVYEWTRDEILLDWLPAFANRIINDTEHHPHPATCKDCGLLPTCKPAQERMVGEASALVKIEGTSLSPAQMVDTLRKVRAIKAQAEHVEAWIREHAAISGRIEGDGFAIEIRTTDKETVDWSKAKPVLSKVFAESELDDVIQIGKTRLEEAIRAQAPKGKKSKFLAEVWEDLDAAGAIEITTSERMEVRPIHAQQPKLEAVAV